MAEGFVEGGELRLLVMQGGEFFFQAFFLGGAGTGFDVIFKLGGVGAELGGEGDDVFGAHPRQGAFVIAMQVDQALEGLVLAGAE